MLSQKVLEAWIQRIEENASARITGNAKDITELTRRIEKLEGGVSLLETICDLREQRLVSAAQEHTKLAEELDEVALELARHIRRLHERIEKLEKRVEPGFHFADMEYVQRVDEECIPDLVGPGKYVELKEVSDESYTDTLNRLFPWGCETESEVITVLVRRVKELEDKQCNLWANTIAMVNDLAQRINTLAENGEFLAERLLSQKRRIEKLERPPEKGD